MRDYKFSTSDIEEIEGGPKKKVLPDGQYRVGIIDMNMVPYKALDAEYLNITFEVIDSDEHDGFRLYEIFNLFHPTKPKAVSYSKYKFGELVKSVGFKLEDFKNFSELMDKTTYVKVYTESSKEWGDKNKIDRFINYDDPKKSSNKFVDSNIADIEMPW